MDAKSAVKNLVDGLRGRTLETYASIRRIVDQSLLNISKCVKKTFDCETVELQQSICDVTFGGMWGVQKSFLSASDGLDMSLMLMVGHTKQDASVRLGSASAHSETQP